MPRPQFSLKTVLWLMAVVGAFCAGAVWQRQQYAADRQEWWDGLKKHVTYERSLHEYMAKLERQLKERPGHVDKSD